MRHENWRENNEGGCEVNSSGCENLIWSGLPKETIVQTNNNLHYYQFFEKYGVQGFPSPLQLFKISWLARHGY